MPLYSGENVDHSGPADALLGSVQGLFIVSMLHSTQKRTFVRLGGKYAPILTFC